MMLGQYMGRTKTNEGLAAAHEIDVWRISLPGKTRSDFCEEDRGRDGGVKKRGGGGRFGCHVFFSFSSVKATTYFMSS